MFSWVRSMTPLRHVLLLGVVIYASAILLWSAVRITTSSFSDTNGHFQPQSIQFLSDLQTETNKSKVIRDFPFGETRARNFRCIGWRTIQECSLIGKLWSATDQNCSQIISNDKIGYCEVEDVDTKERFRVMRTQKCPSFRHGVPFRCQDASKFVNFRVQADQIVQAARNSSFMLPHVTMTKEATKPRDGIVMVVYPKLLASAYATIRVLRNVLKCQLAIDIWFRPDEINANDTSLEPLKHLVATEGNITFQEIHDPRATQFVAKIHAIYHTKFDRVLFLDADNVPVHDPSFLFESAEFLKTGAIFWPDFWNPDHSIFAIYENSLLWELLDMPFTDMFEQESGQLVIDRRRHAAPLELVRFYALHRPNFFASLKLTWGDKDLFRLAWLKLDVPFTMIQTPPGMAGIISDGFLRSDFCGMTMVQHDANGEILFMHRNQKNFWEKLLTELRTLVRAKRLLPPSMSPQILLRSMQIQQFGHISCYSTRNTAEDTTISTCFE
ncbi:unnamed protein product [Peronospora destructor]|uniref:Uncharacterized protein n=1 Tax=Peronospora destructor TaxID=86335 RepID=A0AAV0U5P0_9STRA|nr:unnamed protein product [Peronospora destructor]